MFDIVNLLFKGKASKKYVLFLFLTSLIIQYGPSWIVLFQQKTNQAEKIDITLTQNSGILSPAEDQTKIDNNSQNNCIKYNANEDLPIEKRLKYLKLRDNYYFPTGTGDSWEGTIWLKRLISTTFKSIFIEYEILSDKGSNYPPSLILQLAINSENKNLQEILKIWIPEYSIRGEDKFLQLFRLRQSKDSLDHLSEASFPLPDPVKKNQINSLKIESSGISGNLAGIRMIYTYTSDRNNVSTPFTYSTEIKLPMSNPTESSEKMDLGIGTFRGYKYRVISLEICN